MGFTTCNFRRKDIQKKTKVDMTEMIPRNKKTEKKKFTRRKRKRRNTKNAEGQGRLPGNGVATGQDRRGTERRMMSSAPKRR